MAQTPITPYSKRVNNKMERLYRQIHKEYSNFENIGDLDIFVESLQDSYRYELITMGWKSALLPLFTKTGEVPLKLSCAATNPKKPKWTIYEDSENEDSKGKAQAQKPNWTIYCDNEVNNA